VVASGSFDFAIAYQQRRWCRSGGGGPCGRVPRRAGHHRRRSIFPLLSKADSKRALSLGAREFIRKPSTYDGYVAPDGTLLVDSEAEQVQKCRAAAQGIFSTTERLGRHDLERVLAVSGDRDRHFARGKIRRRIHRPENVGVRFGDHQFPLIAFDSERTKSVEHSEVRGRFGERGADDKFPGVAAQSHGLERVASYT